jgi:tRNA (guanine37-N1)-methyltransferase
MQFIINTLFPDLYTNFLSTSLIKKSIEKGVISFSIQNLFSLVEGNKRIDKKCVGHGAGMVIDPIIIEKAYNEGVAKTSRKPYTIFFSPHGKKLDQDCLKTIYNEISKNQQSLMLFAGRYEGFDVRAEEKFADQILSIGDYVLCGGDLPVMVFIEAFARLIPNVVGKMESVMHDSFYNTFLDCPHYANPDLWDEKSIPSVLKSGNHAAVAAWREEKSIKRSIENNWTWTRKHLHNNTEKKKVAGCIPNHYCILLHNDVMLPDNTVGNSSVTSIDIHDLARSCATYGIKKYYIVTRLEAQHKIVEKFLSFWHNPETNYVNQSRAFALANVGLEKEIEDVIKEIEAKEGKKPITIVTSSRRHIPHAKMINYDDQGTIWKQERPVLFIFGTAHGISPKIMSECDYRLVPLEGLEEFNFLSVRAAVAIILDRWLGIENKIVEIEQSGKYI